MNLIHLFYYEKDFRKLIIDNKGKKTKCYLIDKSCFEQYKSFYEYEEIKNYLGQIDSKRNIDELYNGLPDAYFNKINNKNINLNLERECKIFIKKIKKPQEKVFKCLISFSIVNYTIYDLLRFENLLFKKSEIINLDNIKFIIITNQYSYEIGYFDENNNFIPECIIDCKSYGLYNNISSQNFKTNNYNDFINNKKINYAEINSFYCYKLINDNLLESENKIDYINDILSFINNNNNLDIYSYTCIDCDSEIEILSLKLYNNKEKDIINYNCRKCNSKKSLDIKDYLNNMIKNTYLNKICYACGKVQKDKNNYFSFCTKCNRIFCNDKLCILIHEERCHSLTVSLLEIKNVCLDHCKYYDNNYYFTDYCKKDNKQLCTYCIKEGNHNHLDCIPISISIFSPLIINNIQEEKIVFDILFKTLKKRLSIATDNRIKKVKSEINAKKNNIINDYNNQIKNCNEEEDKKIEEVKNQYDTEIIKIKKEYYNKMTEQINNLCDTMNVILNNIKKKNEIIDDKYNINDKYNDVNNYFKDNNEYEKVINQIKNEYDKKINILDENKNKEINKIKIDYNSLINKINNNKNSKISELDKNIELPDVIENKIKYQICLSKIIFNAYKICNNSNYFYTKNLYTLMKLFYNNKEMNKIFMTEIN